MKSIYLIPCLTVGAALIAATASRAPAQVTSDYPCWADMGDGAGIVDMSYMCGRSSATPIVSSQAATVDAVAESSPSPRASFGRIPGVSACASRLGDAIVEDPNIDYVAGTLDRLLAECAESEVQELSRIPTSRGSIEVIQARSDRSIWVRLPGEDTTYGYGPFASAQDARAWATTRI